MRVFDCEQRSEEWDRLRARPTASNFAEFVTPARGDYSKQATDYACEIVVKRLGIFVERPPTEAMERGIELEPQARELYEQLTGNVVTQVGFVMPDNTDAYGGSPDGLVGDDGLLEIKCPLYSQKVVRYFADDCLPVAYKPQVQGLLMITGRAWCDFMAYHPDLQPFIYRVEADEAYQEKIATCLLQLLNEIEQIEEKMIWTP